MKYEREARLCKEQTRKRGAGGGGKEDDLEMRVRKKERKSERLGGGEGQALLGCSK